MPPRGLLKISQALIETSGNIKSLNLGYNSLCFDENKEELYYISEEFVENMIEYLAATEKLNHLDISGMNFDHHSLIELCSVISGMEYLLSIHLCDNDIRTD